MCLAVPAKIVQIDGTRALVDVGGVRRWAGIELVADAKVGDYVLLHAGFGIQKIDEEEAQETLRLLEELIEAGG